MESIIEMQYRMPDFSYLILASVLRHQRYGYGTQVRKAQLSSTLKRVTIHDKIIYVD